MGYNTNVIILNDSFDQIEKHPDLFVRGIRENMNQRHGTKYERDGSFGIGNFGNVAQVMQTEHADVTQLIAVGGNFATKVLSQYYLPSHHTREGQVEILRAWAHSLGYDLREKVAR